MGWGVVSVAGEGVTEAAGATKCPVLRVNRFDDVIRFDRSQSIANAPEMFAGVPDDPVNGEINVREFLAGAVMFLEGAEHRDRRKLLNRLVRPQALEAIREDVILPAGRDLLARRLAEPDADGVYRLDLVEFCHRVFVHFTAKLIGLVGVDDEAGVSAMSALAAPIAAGSSSQFLDDRTAINEKALEAKRRYVEEFYLPTRRHYEQLLQDVQAGKMAEDDLPVNIMRFIVAGDTYEDEQKSIVESTLMFAASVGTSTQAIVQTIDFLDKWFQHHPEDRPRRTDAGFLLNALQETIRLRAPFSPYNTRTAPETCTVAGHHVEAQQEIHIERVAANRDKTVFGDDADAFNPNRPTPDGGIHRYGVGFGSGTHQCLGLRFVLGVDGAGGAHVHLLRHLYQAGIQPDPDNPPVDLEKDMNKFAIENIPRYTKYPVIFHNWQPPTAN